MTTVGTTPGVAVPKPAIGALDQLCVNTIRTLAMDAFAGMDMLHQQGERFDLVVVDPPAFANKVADVRRALHSYERLARLAVDLLTPDGVLAMASCSTHIPADTFFDTVTRTVTLNEIERTGHALDHPIGFPEGAYLKCIYATL